MAPVGRPKIGKEKRKRVNITLDPSTHAYLRKVGEGNVSMGIHLIVLRHMAEKLHEHVKKQPKRKVSK